MKKIDGKKLTLKLETLRTQALARVRGGLNPPTHRNECVTFDPDPSTSPCSTTGPWQTEWSCPIRCVPQ